MALKKRGFNVDRILNQQREERLRIQAETIRDSEKSKIQATHDDEATDRTSIDTAESGSAGKRKSFLHRLRHPSSGQKDKRGAVQNEMEKNGISPYPFSPSGGGFPGMPGGMGGLNGLGGMDPTIPAISGSEGGGGLGGRAPGTSTKRVSSLSADQ